jgi:hypothetical protein
MYHGKRGKVGGWVDESGPEFGRSGGGQLFAAVVRVNLAGNS